MSSGAAVAQQVLALVTVVAAAVATAAVLEALR
jgi:hypothetical protein